MIRLFGSSDLQRTTAALDDAARRLSRYFLTQLAVNVTFGLIIGIGLLAIGVPNPGLWGILSALLRFVPYVGSFISAALPTALAAAVDPGWALAIETALLYLVVELLVSQAVEPILLDTVLGFRRSRWWSPHRSTFFLVGEPRSGSIVFTTMPLADFS